MAALLPRATAGMILGAGNTELKRTTPDPERILEVGKCSRESTDNCSAWQKVGSGTGERSSMGTERCKSNPGGHRGEECQGEKWGGNEAMLWVYLQEGASQQSLCTMRQTESLFCRQDGETGGDLPPQLMESHVNCFVSL